MKDAIRIAAGVNQSNGRFRFVWLTVICFVIFVFMPSAPLAQTDEVKEMLKLTEVWTGDFDGMVKRRVIRALVVHNKMLYFLDCGAQRGTSYEGLKEFEKFVNKKLKTITLKINVVFIPVTRDKLLPALVKGLGDIAAANLTITPERKKIVDFSDPLLTNVSEILITGPAAPILKRLDDLAGKEIHVRPSSSYYGSLKRLNASFKKQGKPPVEIIPADEYLEDSDLLEMVNAGLIPMVIVDNHKARFWAEIFDHITLHPDIVVNTGGEIASAIRKNSPKLKAVVNEFVKGHKKGTLLGNIVFKRYLKTNKWARNSMSPKELKKFQDTVALFRKYADQYGFDYLKIIALAYQESQLDQSKRSKAGAIGIMQVLPSTARDPNVNIPEIKILEKNIHAGNKYLRFLDDRYFNDSSVDQLNQLLFTFAYYNAGPARVARLRKEAAKMGLDPNVWFGNVEVVAAKRIGRETVQYVSNIYKYYIAYRLIVDQLDVKKKRKRE
jgi:membrane-bound lytic murein transglycosylase MltF